MSQTLRSEVLKPGNYHLGSFEISPAELRFADDKVKLPTSALRLSDRGKELGLRGSNDFFYLKQNAGGSDQVGDERLQYRAIPASETATYFGSVRSGVGQAKVFERKSGMVSKLIKDEGILHHLVSGDRETALAILKGHIQQLRWIVRIAGTVVSMIGVSIALGSLMHLFMGIPILGRVVRGGVLLGSVLIGGSLSLATIALGWFAHHPLFALFVVGGLIAAGVWLSRRQKVSSANAGRMIQRLETRSAVSGSESGPVSPARAEHVFQHLVQIALVDGKLDKTENAFLADWARARSIHDDRIVTLFDEAKRGKDSELTESTREDLFYLISLSLADGHLFPKELQRIQRLSRDLGVNDQELETIIANIRQGKLEETVSGS